jgi:hypothetical protein
MQGKRCVHITQHPKMPHFSAHAMTLVPPPCYWLANPLWPSITHNGFTHVTLHVVILGWLDPADEGTMVLPNVRNYLPNTASHPCRF